MTNDRSKAKVATQTAPPVDPPLTSERLLAVDALRGFDMFWIVGGKEMLLTFVAIFKSPVPDALIHQLEHPDWKGFTAWDLIMPLFLFVVGTAMPFSFSRRLEAGHTKGQLYAKIIRRTLILFVLGMAVQGHLLDFKSSTLHVFANTLQAIAVGYFVSGIVLLNLNLLGQILFTAAMLISFWLLLIFVPLSSHGAGSLEPHANVARAVDEFVLGRFRDGTEYTWVLSSMTFAATVMLGVFSGHVLRSRLSPLARVIALTTLGVACLAGGWAWSEWLGLPIIKHIWTSSMVLWAGGWSYLLLALFYLVIDVAKLQRWAFPFVVIGLNALVIYVAWDGNFIPFPLIAKNLVGGLAAHLGSMGPFLLAFTAVLLWWLVLYAMYRRKIFLRL